MLSIRIARRYFFSKKKTQFINVIAVISMLVVSVGTAALIIAMSVFNGLESVVRDLHHTFHPDLQITAKVGKAFEVNEAFIAKIKHIEGIAQYSEVIEDNAVLNYRDEQMVVLLKGVSANFTLQTDLPTKLTEGNFQLERENWVRTNEGTIQKNKQSLAVIGRGVQIKMGISSRNQMDFMRLWYPKRNRSVDQILSNVTSDKNFTQKSILPAGVFSLEQHYDEKYVFVPLKFAEELLEYGNKRTAIEIKLKDKKAILEVQASLKKAIGKDYLVRTSDEQNVSLFRAIQIEKFFMYLVLSFILGVASFNIFFTLMMLVIEKQKDIAVLQSMGATNKVIGQIFFFNGVLIAFVGAFAGLVLGGVVCLLQQTFGFIKMGAATMVVDAYPVKLLFLDFLYAFITVAIITILASVLPALKASKLVGKNYL